MQLPIATASFQQKFDRENHPSPIQPHRLVASDWPIHILLSERHGLAKSGLIEMQQRPIKGGEISRKDAKTQRFQIKEGSLSRMGLSQRW